MQIFLETFLGNTVLQWIFAGAIIAIVLIVVSLLKRLVTTRLRRTRAARDMQFDGLAAELAGKTRTWLIFFAALYLGSLTLILPERATQFLRTLAIIALLVQGALWGNQIIAFLLSRYVRYEAEDEVSGESAYNLLNFVLRVVLWSLVLLMVLDNLPGVQITSLLAGLGVASVAVALAVQTILSDIFASLSIVLDKPFVIGDAIEVGEYSGAVEHIGLKTTRIRSVTGEELIFSNSDLLNSRIRNYRRMNERRTAITLGVAYETPYDKLQAIPAIIEQEMASIELTRFDRAHLKAMGNSALLYEVIYWVLVPDYRTYMDKLQEVNLRLLKRFEAEGINLPYSTQRVVLSSPQGPL